MKSSSPIPIRYIRIAQVVMALLGAFSLVDFVRTPNAQNAFMLAGEIVVVVLGFQAVRKLEQGDGKK